MWELRSVSKRCICAAAAFILNFSIFSQGYSVVERTDLRRYDNGKYIGLTSREVRSFISTCEAPNEYFANSKQFSDGAWYNGYFYVMEETNRNMQQAAAGIHDSIDSTFFLSDLGKMTMFLDNGFPTFRSFPTFPEKDFEKLKKGDAWQGTAERAVDPLNKGIITRMPITVLYENCGSEEYKGEKVLRLKAKWGSNYGISYRDPKGDSSLVKTLGSHNADILVCLSTGDVILIIDRIDETFIYSDGRQINFKGTLNHFTEYPPAIQKEKMFPALNRIVAKSQDLGKDSLAVTKGWGETGSAIASAKPVTKPVEKTVSKPVKKPAEKIAETSVSTKNFSYEETSKGLRLSIRDIKFKPDSAEILETERPRLKEIADVLKMAEGSHFLIEGHTASTGRPQGEQTLSEQRARTIARELENLGVKAGSFITKGYGGKKTIGDNNTDSGRALNRRVEITILK